MLTQDNAVFILIDYQERMLPAVHNHAEIGRKACILARGARLLEMEVIVTRQYPKGLGDTVPALVEALGDHVFVDKDAFGCMAEPVFKEKLAALGKRNVIVAGVEAHVCVQQTVLEMLDAGYAVYLAADCCGSRSKTDKGYAEWRMALAGAKMTTMESILFEIMRHKDHPARKAIQALIK